MRNRKLTNRGGSMVEFTMLVPVWLPLLIGTLWIGSSMIRGQQVTQMARDLASMYSRDSTNLNFAAAPTTSSNAVLDDITKQLGTLTSTGNGVVIFSTITCGEQLLRLGRQHLWRYHPESVAHRELHQLRAFCIHATIRARQHILADEPVRHAARLGHGR